MSTKAGQSQNGNLATYANNVRGLPVRIVEAAGTSQARTTTIAWHPRYHLPVQVATAGLTTSFAYDPRGELIFQMDADTIGGASRSWAFTWSRFNVISVTGPRTDVNQTTQMSYDSLGRLATVTDALGHVTRIPGRLGGGLPTAIVDPNGVTTRFTYDARQRPLTQSVITAAGPLTTSIVYDAAGNVLKVTLPDGSYLANSYDAAHRLIETVDALSEPIGFTLDALGDRTQTAIATAGGGSVVWQYLAGFDALGRKVKEQRGAGQTSQFAYDGNSNLVAVLDPLSRTTAYSIDALNRVAVVTDPANGLTKVTYDTHDRPLSVSAPNAALTLYAYDGFGRMIKRVSPDTGTTLYTYDLADNLTQSVDSAGVITRHSYDALNRLTSTSYPADAAETVVYNYDESGHGFGIGRLTSMADAVGTLGLTYDERGNRLSETRASGSVGLSTLYSYDPASRMASITYPSGYKARYIRNAVGRVSGVALLAPGAAHLQIVATGVTYAPFGPMTGLTYGNGIAETRALDGDYRMTGIVTPGAQSLDYSYDAADRVTAIADNLTPINSQSFGYDVLDHLTGAAGVYGSYAWTYDGVGNRLSENTGGSVTASYSYLASSNRLASIAGGGTEQDFAYTGAGSIATETVTGGAETDLAYNQAERLASVATGGNTVAAYAYDGFGRRFSKALRRSSVLFAYEPAGHLLEELTGPGVAVRDTIYLNGVPVAQVMPVAGKVAYLHTDHLGTPQVATNAASAIVWSANYEPFGQLDGLPSGTITQNLRFPGQYV